METNIKADEPIDKVPDAQGNKYTADDWSIGGLLEAFWNFLLAFF